MGNEELKKYLVENTQSGYSLKDLSKALIDGGWDPKVVADTVSEFSDESQLFQIVPEIKETLKVEPYSIQNPSPLIDIQSSPSIVEKSVGPKDSAPLSVDEGKKPPSRRMRLFVIELVILLFTGVGGVSAYFIFSPKALTPDMLLLKMRDATSDVHSLSYQTTIDMDFSGKDKNTFSAGEEITGELKLNTISTGTVNIIGGSATTTELDAHNEISGNAGSGAVSLIIDGAFDIRVVDRVVYVRVTQFPQILDMIGLKKGLNDWKGKWIKIDPKKESSFTTLVPFDLASSSTHVYSQKESGRILKVVQENWPILTSYVEENPKPKIDGEEMYHLHYGINKEKLKIFLTEILSEQSKLQPLKAKNLSLEEINTAVDLISGVEGEIFISKKDYLLRRFTSLIPVAFSSSSLEVSGTVNFDMTFSKFNSPTTITAPTNSTSFKEFFELMVGKSLEMSGAKARDAKRNSDIGQIQFGCELYYSAHRRYPPSLTSLVSEGFIPSLPKDPSDDTQYLYVPLKNGLSYALGASLEVADSQMLKSDTDQKTTSFSTDDSKGCMGEVGRYCYDVGF